MGIQTSQITTSSDGDLSLNPDGTGKVVLPDLSGSGEVPMAVDTDGKVKPLDEREFTELSAIDPGDNIMVQRGTGYYRIDATNLGGLGLADPNPPTDIVWSPQPPGSGTQSDPYVLTSATVYMPGGTATSVESCQIINQKPDSLVLISEVGGKVGVRMDQPGKICNNDGKTPFFNFGYVDAPDTTSGQDYDGLMRIGQSSIYVKWVVTQVANNTSFGPISSPNASPTTVDYAADGKYGTVSGDWADGDQTLTASNMVFSVNGGTMDSSSKSISDGDRIAIGFLDSAVAAAAEGETITGILSGPTYYSEISMVKDTVPAPFTIQPRTDQTVNTETTTGNEPIKGINAPTTISAAGSSANQLTNAKVSVNGATAVTSGTFNPGDSLQGFGTTGGSNNTTYQATFTIGGVATTWDVSTSTVAATIGQPIITSPANGSVDLVPDVVLTGSAYDPQNGAGAHSASTWEVYEAGAGAAVSPSIATTDGESPLTLSGPAPAGLRDKVVMVDSTSPTVVGDETQASSYTLTTSTITNVEGVTSYALYDVSSVSDFPTTKDYATNMSEITNFDATSLPIEENVPYGTAPVSGSQPQPFLVDLGVARPNIDYVRSASNGQFFAMYGSNTGNADWVLLKEQTGIDSDNPVNSGDTPYRYLMIFQTNGPSGKFTNGMVSDYYYLSLATPPVNTLTFNSPNPDLKYFREEDVVQGGAAFWAAALNEGLPNGPGTGSGTYDVEANAKWTANLNQFITLNSNVYMKGVAGQTITLPIPDYYEWVSDDGLNWTYAGQTSKSFTPTTYYVMLSGNFPDPGVTIEGDLTKVVSTDLVNNKMTVSGGAWIGSSEVRGGALLNEFLTGPTFTSSSVVGLSYSIDTSSSVAIPRSQTLILNGSTTNIDSTKQYHVYASSNGTSWTRVATGVAAGTIISRIIAPYVAIVSDHQEEMSASGDPFGDAEVTLDITGTGEVAATNGAQVTLTNVEGRWVGSGSENFAGKTFYAATVAQESAPGAPSDPVDTGKYTAVTPSATTLTTATLDDTNLTEDKFYYSRVKYSDGSIESDFSEYHEFGTKDDFAPEAGDPYGGGYFLALVEVDGVTYRLITADIAPAREFQYKTTETANNFTNDGQLYGGNATVQGAAQTQAGTANYPLFNFTINDPTGPNAGVWDPTNTVGTGYNGYNDWYVPARQELFFLYAYAKKTTGENSNYGGSGSQSISLDPYYPRSTGWSNKDGKPLFPKQSKLDIPTSFQQRLWASSEYNDGSAHYMAMKDGLSGGWAKSHPSYYVQFFRREPV